MTDNRLKQHIASAFDRLTPKTTFEDICSQVHSAPERRQVTMTVIQTNNTNKFAKAALSAVAACLLLAAGLFGGIYYSNNMAVDSIIDIDVNPSIELTTNKNDRVLSATAVNHDGDDILDGMDLTKTNLKVAVNAIVGSMVQKGYLVDDTSSILVSVQNKSQQKAATIRAEVLADIDNSLGQYNIPAPVINQTVTENHAARDLAEDAGISLGKAVFIKNLVAKDASLNEKELAALTITQLAELVVEKNLDIRDIADYDADDSIWENIADSIEEVDDDEEDKKEKPVTTKKETTTQATTKAPTTAIAPLTEAQAKAKALAHAGVKESKVTFTKMKLDRDDGVAYFDIEFYVGNVEYDYEIHATTGQVLEYNRDIDDDIPVTTKKTKTTTKAADRLTEKQAKAKALAHAGVKESKVTFTKVKLDRDDGVAYFDIEFYVGNVEYDYEIHATTGQVLEHDKDIDDDIPVPSKMTTTTTAAVRLTEDQAKAKALAHAGLTADEVVFEKTELDRDDGVVYYEVEFRKDRTEYTYEIDATTGRVLEHDVDIDD